MNGTRLLTKMCKFCAVLITLIGVNIRIAIFLLVSMMLLNQFILKAQYVKTYSFQNQDFYFYDKDFQDIQFQDYKIRLKLYKLKFFSKDEKEKKMVEKLLENKNVLSFIFFSKLIKSGTNINVKVDYLPIYKRVSKVEGHANKIMLKEHKGIVSYIYDGMERDIYDLKTHSNILDSKTVIKRERFTKRDILQNIKVYKSIANNSLVLRDLIRKDKELKLIKSKQAMRKFEEILNSHNYKDKKDFYKVEKYIHYMERDFYIKQLKDKNISLQSCKDMGSVSTIKNKEFFDICNALSRTQSHLKQVLFTDVRLGNYKSSNISIEPFLEKLIEVRSNPLLIKEFRFDDVAPYFKGSSLYVSEELCREGNATQCFNVAKKYEEGKEVRVDIEKAMEFYENGCVYNNLEACLKAGKLYENRNHEDRDLNIAAYFYEISCDSNNAEGCLRRGNLYDDVHKEEKALKLFYKSCTLKNKEGCYQYNVLQKELYKDEKDVLEDKFNVDCSLDESKICSRINGFYKGKFPKNLTNRLNKNIVTVGYSDTSYKDEKKQLITLKLTETNSCYSEKKKDTYYLCMSPIFGENSDEEYDVELAIERLEKNKIPSKNNAYLYGKNFKFKKKHCIYISLEKDNFFLTSYDNKVSLTRNGKDYFLINKRWGEYENNSLILEFGK